MKVVKCTYSSGDDGFTVGKEYEVIDEYYRHLGELDVEVVDDNGDRSYLLDEEFEIVSE
jgi:hypothetical protein